MSPVLPPAGGSAPAFTSSAAKRLWLLGSLYLFHGLVLCLGAAALLATMFLSDLVSDWPPAWTVGAAMAGASAGFVLFHAGASLHSCAMEVQAEVGGTELATVSRPAAEPVRRCYQHCYQHCLAASCLACAGPWRLE